MDKLYQLVKLFVLLVVSSIMVTFLLLGTYSAREKCDCTATDITTHANEAVPELTFPSEFHPETFTHDNTECKVQVYRDKDLLYKDRNQQNASSASCTTELFQEYFRNKNHFYSDGKWFAPETETPAGSKFLPHTCLFDDDAISPGSFAKCLTTTKIKRVLVLGDSNGHLLYERLLEFFRRRSERCDLVRREGDETNLDPYFEVPGSQIVQKFKGCTGCYSQIHTCTDVDRIDGSSMAAIISIEYIGALHIIDQRLVKQNKRESVLVNKTLYEETFMEFLLQKYFPYHGFPDLWLFSTPIHHEAEKQTLEELRPEIVDFRNLIHRYLPRSTTMVIFPNIRCCAHISLEKAQVFYKLNKKSKNEVMHQMNHLLFDVLRDDFLSPNTNILGFLDQGVLACPFTCVWHKDDAHMQDEWYDVMVESVLSMLCTGH